MSGGSQPPSAPAAAPGRAHTVGGKNPAFWGAIRNKFRLSRSSISPLLAPLKARWNRSLALRVITVNVCVAAILIILIVSNTIVTISNDLNNRSRDNALNDSARATVAAQRILDASSANDRSSLASLMLQVRNTIRDTSASSLIYMRRQPGQTPAADAPLDFRTGPGVMEGVSSEISDAVIAAEAPQVWQLTELSMTGTATDSTAPGIIVGTSLQFPGGVGVYNLFIAYDLSDTSNSLKTISRSLIIAGIAIVLLIAALSWLIVSAVLRPIRAAADVTRKIAGGDQAARMVSHNDTDLDALSTNFNEMADTLRARINELDALSVMQRNFVSDVSHELRTPLTTIRLASDVLKNSSEPGKNSAKAVRVLTEQVARFESLLTDLLEISRYDAGQVQIETEPTSIVELTRDVVAQLQPLSKSLIEMRAQGGYSSIDVDPRRIRRILSNLIGNAIEHGEEKPIIVTVNSHEHAVAVAVRDYGVGMTEAQTRRVFDRFWRADPARQRTLGGTGLGLAIASEDATVHGGTIEVWSKPGRGSNFRLTLPTSDTHTGFLSPLPLVPESESAAADSDTDGTGWIKRPRGWLLRKGR